MRVKDAVGRFGEQVACDHLEKAGLAVLERNWRCAAGEIDVVALDNVDGSEPGGPILVVAEVKTRSSTRFGSPMEAVDRTKQARLRRLAVLWMTGAAARTGPQWASVRFDVVAVVRRPDAAGRPGGVEVTHVRGAF